jgi:CubicO group peptidase (beta-lactamase class C family)
MTLAQALDAAIDAHPGRSTLSGAVRISRAGELLLERAYGHASRQLNVPNTSATRFHIASMTKMFIAAAVVRRALDGALSLQAHPSAYVPELARLDPGVTLHHLLSHTAGLADIYDVPDLALEMAAMNKRGGAFIDYLAALPPLSPPGQSWRYSTTGFLLLAYVLERAAGVPFAQVIADLFLTPLGMADTGPDDPLAVNPGRAGGHIARATGWRNAPNDALAEVDGPREFYSTVGDLDRWATAMLECRVLSEAGQALSFTPHARVGAGSDFDPSLGYGYGWFLGDTHRFIGGMTGGFRSAMWQYPAERLTITMLWNNERTDSQGLHRALRAALSG